MMRPAIGRKYQIDYMSGLRYAFSQVTGLKFIIPGARVPG
jgi:hypothetical protein